MKTVSLVVDLSNIEEGLETLDKMVNEIRWTPSTSPHNTGYYCPIKQFQDSIIKISDKYAVIIRAFTFGQRNS